MQTRDAGRGIDGNSRSGCEAGRGRGAGNRRLWDELCYALPPPLQRPAPALAPPGSDVPGSKRDAGCEMGPAQQRLQCESAMDNEPSWIAGFSPIVAPGARQYCTTNDRAGRYRSFFHISTRVNVAMVVAGHCWTLVNGDWFPKIGHVQNGPKTSALTWPVMNPDMRSAGGTERVSPSMPMPLPHGSLLHFLLRMAWCSGYEYFKFTPVLSVSSCLVKPAENVVYNSSQAFKPGYLARQQE
jgi:hypothetical protein